MKKIGGGLRDGRLLMYNLFLILMVFCSVILRVTYNVKVDSIARMNEIRDYSRTVISCLNVMYDDEGQEIIEIDDGEIQRCVDGLKTVDSSKFDLDDLYARLENIMKYYAVSRVINGAFLDEEGIVREGITDEEIEKVISQVNSVSGKYYETLLARVEDIRAEKNRIQDAKSLVDGLYDENGVRTAVNRTEYNKAFELVDGLRQASLKGQLSERLEPVLAVVEKKEQAERERIARERAEAERRERERQAQIAASWVELRLPEYISQNNVGIYNGCEAASLLMALKYKGYLGGVSLASAAEAIPKSDDPNTGFYLDIYSLEPRDEAHWIAPAPLAEFGRSYSGNGGVFNATGYSLNSLDQEVANGNPVVIYLTYNFASPYNYSRGVPKNLHVLVLTGYNSYTGDQVLIDPWGSSSNNRKVISYNLAQYLYNAVGMRAIVVR